MIVNKQVLMEGTGCTSAVADQWLGFINKALDQFKISDPASVAAFLANAGVETGGLTKFSEGMSYRAERLAAVWPSRYALPQTAEEKARKTPPARVPNALGISLAGKPEALANNVYANRMGNGDTASGDGWKYRGGGLFQITGRFNYTKCANAIGIDVVKNPDLIRGPNLAAALSAVWFFVEHGCVEAAQSGNFSKVVQIINGQPPTATNHGPLRQSLFLAAKRLLS